MNTNIPVKIMRVEDFENLAIKWCEDWFEEPINQGEEHSLAVLSKFQELLSNYEKETSQILERKHFDKDSPDCVFEGFEKVSDDYIEGNHLGIYFSGQVSITIFKEAGTAGLLLDKKATLYDFIYHIDRYNKTASEPINLKFTENFIKRIVG